MDSSIILPSIDHTPWSHPFISQSNLKSFKEYSEEVWACSTVYCEKKYRGCCNQNLSAAFSVNMAQSMYKWARLSKKYIKNSTLFSHPMDNTLFNLPQWEDYYGDIGSGIIDDELYNYLENNRNIDVDYIRPGLKNSLEYFKESKLAIIGENNFKFLKKMGLLNSTRSIEDLLSRHRSFENYFSWALSLKKYDVIYSASAPFAAYASGKPYCVFSVGGDLQYDCGLDNEFGFAMRQAFGHARFMFVSNPHTLGHCRRLGFNNAVYLPYPMDTERYTPGRGKARRDWEDLYGNGVYFLITARLDPEVKGFDRKFFNNLVRVSRLNKKIKFIFLDWGSGSRFLKDFVKSNNLENQFIIIPAVGKSKLLDYYRSCDVVIDQLVFGYYGATFLEAASTSKPVVMFIRKDHYLPLYNNDVAPIVNVETDDDLVRELLDLSRNKLRRTDVGSKLRKWVVRNHGEERTVPLMLSMLQISADQQALRLAASNPLIAPLSHAEVEYHKQCKRLAL